MTMDPFAGPQSPRTQSFAGGGPQGAISVEDAFVDGFTQMAYDTFTKAHPSLVKDTVTFRTLDTDPEDGSGLGVFILMVSQEVFYVPVIVADNTIKPIDMFYSRRLNRYFPLTPEWLVEANKSALNELGVGVKPPKHLQNDVDITRVVQPPIGGRFGYAEDANAMLRSKVASSAARGELDRDAKGAFTWAGKYDPNVKRASVLPALLSTMPNAVKVAFARTLKTRPSVLRKMASLYGVKAVTTALQLREEKIASAPSRRGVFIATSRTPAARLREEFGSKTAEAFSATRSIGYYVRDDRTKTASVYAVDYDSVHLEQPKSSGVYHVFLTDGSVEEVLVVVSPINSNEYESFTPYRLRTSDEDQRAPKALVIFKDGRCMRCVSSSFVAEPVVMANDAEFRKSVAEWTKERPANGQHGVFISAGRGDLVATEPVTVKSSRSAGDETSYTTEFGPVIVVSNAMKGTVVVRPKNARRLALSSDFRWLPIKDKWVNQNILYTTPEEVMHASEASRLKNGSKKVAVKLAANAHFYVGSAPRPLPLHEAVEKIALDYGVSLRAAVRVAQNVVLYPKLAHWTKSAADDKKKSKSPPDEGGDEDPNGMPMDPAMMAAMQAPPPPSGYELAIAEQLQLIQSQIAALNDKSMTLQQLQMRQQQIDGGGGMMAAPTGAASLMAGAPQGPMGGMLMAPPFAQAGGGTGMDPMLGQPVTDQPGMSTMGQSGAPPGLPMGQGAPMDPSMQPGRMPTDPSMMDPSMMGPDLNDPAVMRPSMSAQDLDAGNIEQTINPAFLDRAGDLQQADVFDAAAITSLAQNKNLRSIVQSHLPRAEETLDNLGRMKLLFDLREGKIKGAIGNDTYTDLSQTLRDVFSQLGDLLLKLNQTTDQLVPAALG